MPNCLAIVGCRSLNHFIKQCMQTKVGAVSFSYNCCESLTLFLVQHLF